MGLKEFSKRLNESKSYHIFIIILGIIVFSGYEQIYPIFFGIMALAIGIFGLYKISKRQKPMCEYCGYIAVDERELHNHQIACEKKNKK